MDDSVFVIHGVANRDQQGFAAMVADLQTASGLDMVPVYWGDLGADDRFITAALPTRRAAVPGAHKDSGLRDADEPPSVALPEPVLVSALASQPEVPEQWPQVEAAVRERLARDELQFGSSGLRHAPLREDPEDALEYLAEEWPKTEWLRRTDAPLLLFETSRSLAEALIEAADLWADGGGSYDGLRASDGDAGRLRTLVRNRLRGLDRVAGAAIQAAAGRLDPTLRTEFGPGTTQLLGDVLVYQRHLRHGESQNVTDNIAGAVPNASLTERGHEQAALAARPLVGERIGAVYSSTALRAQQTAQPLATAAGVDVQVLPDLVEVGIGRHEGSSNPAVRRQTADVLSSWVVDNDLTQQVADGETGLAVTARMSKVFQVIAEQHRGETVAVVGHVASLTVALGQLCTVGAAVWGTPLPHAQPFLIEWHGSTWCCPSWPEAN